MHEDAQGKANFGKSFKSTDLLFQMRTISLPFARPWANWKSGGSQPACLERSILHQVAHPFLPDFPENHRHRPFNGHIIRSGNTLQTRATTSEILYQLLEQKTIAVGRSLADTIERSASTGDYYSIRRHLKEAQKSFPEIRYIIVRNHDEKIVASTFDKWRAAGSDEIIFTAMPASMHKLRPLAAMKAIIMDIRLPIAGGYAGFVQIGVLDPHRQSRA